MRNSIYGAEKNMNLSDVIICSDFDGTLSVSENNCVLPTHTPLGCICEENIRAVKKFTADGGRFVVASGRSPLAMDFLYDIIPIDDIFAGTNGAAMYSRRQKKFAFRHAMKVLPLDFIIKAQNAYGELPEYHVTDEQAVVHKFYPGHGESATGFISRFSSLLKIIFVERDEQKMTLLKKMLEENFSDSCEIVLSCPFLVEAFDKGAGKSEIIDFFRKENPHKTIVALGDYENDIAMLTKADIALCPENAVPDVKRVCDKTFRHAGNGFVSDVIDYLEKL